MNSAFFWHVWFIPVTIRQFLSFLLLVVFLGGILWVLTWPVDRPEPQKDVEVLLGGDFYAGDRLRNYGLPEHPERYTEEFPEAVHESDLHIVNLEAPLTAESDTNTSKQYWLRTPPDIGKVLLKGLSVDAVGLANNHVLDYGEAGLKETMNHLKQLGVRYTGAALDRKSAEKPVFFERQEQTLAYLAFSNTYPESYWADSGTVGTAFGQPERVHSAVQRAEERADRVIVSFHWGKELERSFQKYQQRLARLSMRAGADVVFGHHPHTLQSIEEYRNGVIFYSLGNYFFSTLSRDVQYGLLAEVRFPPEPSSSPSYGLHLMNVNNYRTHYRPRHVESFDDPLGVGIKLERLKFFRRTATVSPEPSRTGPQFSD